MLIHILQGIPGIPLETDDLRPINHTKIVYCINIHSSFFLIVQSLAPSRQGGGQSRHPAADFRTKNSHDPGGSAGGLETALRA